MSEDDILIHELAGRAGTTVRTIRYYTDEGLLPQPNQQGRYAYYTPAHLNRLLLINRMKEAFLPLREIRQILTGLSDEEVQQRLNEKTASEAAPFSASEPPRIEPGTKALDYIARVLENQANFSHARPASQLPAPAPLKPPAAGEVWQRITLAEGVELHLREQGDAGKQRRVQQLIAFAQRLFHERKKEE